MRIKQHLTSQLERGRKWWLDWSVHLPGGISAFPDFFRQWTASNLKSRFDGNGSLIQPVWNCFFLANSLSYHKHRHSHSHKHALTEQIIILWHLLTCPNTLDGCPGSLRSFVPVATWDILQSKGHARHGSSNTQRTNNRTLSEVETGS